MIVLEAIFQFTLVVMMILIAVLIIVVIWRFIMWIIDVIVSILDGKHGPR